MTSTPLTPGADAGPNPHLDPTLSETISSSRSSPSPGPGRLGKPLGITSGVIIAAAVIAGAYWLHGTAGRGAPAALSLLIGATLGIIMQRGRFCFFCIFRDHIEHRDARGLFAVLTALAVGSLCYAVIFGAFLPSAAVGRFPPDAHIGPVSWVLVVAGLAFGGGMALSGACISGHLYRLGEGYSRAPFALIGSLIGFGLGFMTWRPLYESTISKAPLPWLPQTLGYGGSLAVQLAVLGLIALLLLRRLPARQPSPGGPITWRTIGHNVFGTRWTPGTTGAMVGVLGALAYLRVAPLGVTSQIGSVARTILSDAGVLAGRLNGLDTFAGCITLVIHTISNNGLLIGGLALASWAMALVGGHFGWTRLTWTNASTSLVGGVLMGWGSMLALGCTVGTLLSGIMAFSVSGWVFAAAVYAAVWVAVKLGVHTWGEA